MPNPLDITKFTQHEKVIDCLKQLKDQYGEHGEKKIVSDVIDDNGHQYVNLVQKGGGVLGVALVGYTYILECMNIRFLKLAGTSAGAINTALMTVIGKKADMKSDKILDAICKLDFFSFVDGHPTAKWAIKNFIQSDNFKKRLKIWAIVLSCFFGLLITTDIFLTMFQHKDARLVHWTLALYILTGFMIFLLMLLVFYCVRLVRRLKNAGFGINPGNAFYDWIKGHMLQNGVKTVTDLRNKATCKVDGMKLRHEHPNKMEGLTGDVTFIASELVTQSKIQFPGMCNLFRLQDKVDELQPAGFVRASMSIPIFFESYVIKDIPCTHDDIKAAWQKLNVTEAPSITRFVDGGILSNFPVSVFYNPDVEVPRLPVFGIDLDDSEENTEELNPGNWSLGQYLGNLFNTVRNYYDRDFLIKNSIYKHGIGKVKIKGFNWLDFFLSDEKKIQLFVIGACAAKDFLLDFDWNEYKIVRAEAKKNKLL